MASSRSLSPASQPAAAVPPRSPSPAADPPFPFPAARAIGPGGGVPPQMLQEKPLTEGLVFTFYTYVEARIPREERWKPTGLRDIFFNDYEDVRRTVLAMREDIAADPDMQWETTNIEKVETVAICQSSVLALLNDGPGAFVEHYEVLETIGRKDES